MAAIDDDLPIIAIVGPTASGKTSVALNIAQRYNCEIIAADSRTIYRGLDIGTAKPTLAEQKLARHWGLDLVEPSQRFSAKAFQDYANKAIQDMHARHKSALVVGGTGLYINSLMYDYDFPPVDMLNIDAFANRTLDELQKYCDKNNIIISGNPKNKRHVLHSILRNGHSARREWRLDKHKYIVGIATPDEVLRDRIQQRATQIFASNVVEEAIKSAQAFGWDAPGLTGNVYRVARELHAGTLTHDQAVERFATLDWQLARRQMTWFRRDPNILWVQLEYVEEKVAELLEIALASVIK